jgi:hypothetical protein
VSLHSRISDGCPRRLAGTPRRVTCRGCLPAPAAGRGLLNQSIRKPWRLSKGAPESGVPVSSQRGPVARRAARSSRDRCGWRR